MAINDNKIDHAINHRNNKTINMVIILINFVYSQTCDIQLNKNCLIKTINSGIGNTSKPN